MSDEEKKAMKYFYNLRATIDESNMLFDEDINVKCGKETIEQITIVLNLIEKQSKEIEELKEKNEYLPNWVSKKYISKDEIKAKIEELKQKKYILSSRESEIEILQSLLEKEE